MTRKKEWLKAEREKYVSSKRKYDTFLYYLEFRKTFVTKSPNLIIGVGGPRSRGKTGSIQFNHKNNCLPGRSNISKAKRQQRTGGEGISTHIIGKG